MAIRFLLWFGLCLAAPVPLLAQGDSTATQSEPARPAAAQARTWPGWRGSGRDGHTAWLPQQWRDPVLLWSHPLPGPGVGGVAATDDFLVVSSRDAADQNDLFICLDPITGSALWQLDYPAPLELDYGNSPRATPMIADPLVYLLGAGGQLTCVDLDSGQPLWKCHLVDDLGGERPIWGYGGSPLLVDDLLIVQSGGREHGIVALSAASGAVVWRGAAEQTGYAALQTASWNGRQQIVGFDYVSIGGWDPRTGGRLWSIRPKGTREFHVPMPMVLDDALITAGENHGTLLYRIDTQTGTPNESPEATYFELAPDMHSPLVAGGLVLGVHEGLHALDIAGGLKLAWLVEDSALDHFCSLIAAEDRLLVLSEDGELLLVDIGPRQGSASGSAGERILGREKLGGDVAGTLAHPALVGDVLYVRGNRSIQAWSLRGATQEPKQLGHAGS